MKPRQKNQPRRLTNPLPEMLTSKTFGSEELRLKILERVHQKQRPGMYLTERDLEIIKAVYEYRVLTTPQIQTLFFPGSNVGRLNACRNRLKLLFHNGYLWRGEIPTTTAEGKKPLIYRIDKKAVEIVADLLDVETKQLDWHPNERSLSFRGLDHLLKTNDVRIALTVASKQQGLKIKTWLDERTLKRDHAKEKVTITNPKGRPTQAVIIPDGYFHLWHPKKSQGSHYFLEVDMGTETGRTTTTAYRDWVRKIKGYMAYNHTDLFVKRYRGKSFRMLTVTTSARRLANLKAKTEETGGKKLFWFTTFDQLTPETALTTPIWQVASLDEPKPLVW